MRGRLLLTFLTGVNLASLALLVVWRPLGLPGSQRCEARFPQFVLAASCGGVVCFLSYVGLMVPAMRAGLVA